MGEEIAYLDSRAMLKKINGKESWSVFWAKLQSFPWWPARLASKHEEEELGEFSKRSTKIDQVAVIFLGIAKTKAWVNVTNIKPFTPDTIVPAHSELFKEKKFFAPGQKDFRYSVREAMRITEAGDDKIAFSEEQKEMVEKLADKEEKLNLPSNQMCAVCKGSESSGPLLFCNQCNVASSAGNGEDSGTGVATHFHCLPKPQKYRDVLWYCNDCCHLKGMKPGEVIDVETSKGEKDAKGNKDDGTGGEKKRGRPKVDSKSKSKDRDRTDGDDGDEDGSKEGSRKKRKDKNDTEDHDGGTKGSRGKSNQDTADSGARKGTRGHVPVVPPGISSMKICGRQNKSMAKEYASEESESEDEEDTMDYCFVCGDGGTLVLCDFPNCPRAYHQACIAPTFPQVMDELPGTCAESMEDPWFCPCHTCNFCNTLQTTPNLDPRFLVVPKHFHQLLADKSAGASDSNNSSSSNSNLNGNVDSIVRDINSSSSNSDRNSGTGSNDLGKPLTIRQAPLKLCEGCPFSVCNSCQRDIEAAEKGSESVAKKLFQQRSFMVPPLVSASNAYRSKSEAYLYCGNCCISSPRMKLSRILEMAWSRMSQSRFALPFFTNFLRPKEMEMTTGGDQDEAMDVDEAAHLSRFENEFPEQTQNMRDILFKVHSQQYSSISEFTTDVKALREVICKAESSRKAILSREDQASKRGERSNSVSSIRSDNSLTGTKKVRELVEAGFMNDGNSSNSLISGLHCFPSSAETESLQKIFDAAFKLCESVLNEKKWQIAKYESEMLAEMKASVSEEGRNSSSATISTTGSDTETKRHMPQIPSDLVINHTWWRKECERELPLRQNSNVQRRTMPEWVHYMQGSSRRSRVGGWNNDNFQNFDKENPQVGTALKGVLHEESYLGTAELFSSQEPMSSFNDMDFRALDVAKIMSSMDSSARREEVSLLEEGGSSSELQNWKNIQEHYKISHPGGGTGKSKHTSEDAAICSGNTYSVHSKRALKNYSDGNLDENMSDDHTLQVLDRLKELTRKSLHLESELRRDYLATKQFVKETGIERVVVGELPLVRELKLANDDLRWRLSQKNRALAASQDMVDRLQRELDVFKREKGAELE